MARKREIIIKDTHRGLWYEDGKLVRVLTAGRYRLPRQRRLLRLGRRPVVQLVLVDVRERDLTIKGQEILTGDKVAVRVSLIVQFRVVDAQAGAEAERLEAEARAAAHRLEAENEARVRSIRTQAEIESLRQREEAAEAYSVHPALLRLEELETLRALASADNAQLYVS